MRLPSFGGGSLDRSDPIGQSTSTGGPRRRVMIAASAVPESGQCYLVPPTITAQHFKS
jgi:hypothetical protein